MSKKVKTFKEKWQIKHEYSKRTGLYKFVGKTLLKLIVIFLAIGAAAIALNHFFSLGDFIENFLYTHDKPEVLTLFLVSESFLGWIPPDLFIIWAKQFDNVWLWFTILGTISYVGGMNAYFIGKLFLKFPRIKHYVETRNEIFFIRIRKWGGIIVVLAALFPLPFATTTLVAGMVKYPFKLTALYGLTRYIRITGYGLLIFYAMDKFL